MILALVIGFDVEMAFKNVDDLQPVLDITKENHIPLVNDATDVGKKLSPRSAKIAGLGCQLSTTITKLANKVIGQP